MKETKRYIQIQTIARQLCDIMQQHELKDIGELKEWLEHNSSAIEIIKSLMDDSELSKRLNSTVNKTKNRQFYLSEQNSKTPAPPSDYPYQSCCCCNRTSHRVWSTISQIITTGKHQTLASTISSKLSPVIITPNGQHYDLSKVLTDTTHNLNIAYKSTEEIKYTYQPPAVDIEEEGYKPTNYSQPM